MKHLKLFEEFKYLKENEVSLESIDKAPERLKDTRGMYATKPPKAIYLKTITKFGEKVLNFVKTQMGDRDLFLFSDNQWLDSYMKAKGEEVFSKGDPKALERSSATAADLQKNEIISRIGSSKDLEYVKIDKLAFKEFNIYKVEAYGLDKYNSYGVHYQLGVYHFWFITKKDAKFKDNVKSLSRAFGLSSEEETGPKPSWAILIAKNPYRSSDAHYSWMRNDGADEPIVDSSEFRKIAKRGAERLAQRSFYEYAPGTFKIYTNRDKFVEDYKKLSGFEPKL